MSRIFSNSSDGGRIPRLLASLLIALLLAVSVPTFATAEEAGGAGEQGTDTSESTDATDSGDGESGDGTGDGNDGTAGDSDGDGNDGESGDGNTADGEEGEEIPVTSENEMGDDGEGTTGDDGTTGDEGDEGSEGDEGGGGDDGTEVTGGQTESGTTTTLIETGDATAGGEVHTDANNNIVSSETGTSTATGTPEDFDTFTFNATGTNDATVDNTGTTSAKTGENSATSSEGGAIVKTGEAAAVLNLANLVNTNVVNSSGFIHLLNKMMEVGASLDLRKLFFPDGMESDTATGTCSLMSCVSEDIVYNVDQMNNATITNDALLEAVTGRNSASGDVAAIETGDAYGAANILNVANTNIIDSNYLLLVLNALGALDGDLVFPAEDLFMAFFGKPNGMSRIEQQGEDSTLNDTNVNDALVNNDLDSNAESGQNQATTTIASSTVKTGNANAENNLINEINKNLFGGDSLYIFIRIHGSWDGQLYGLPAGLTWERTDDGVFIYNEDAEIAPSQIIEYDIDSYTANFSSTNTAAIDNNVDIDAISGENQLEGGVGTIQTGDAYAGANVMNIANTNVIGRNWMMATMNIFGDLKGDISFGRPDLWIGGQVSSADTPVGPGSKLTYTYTIKNNGDLKASNVTFIQDLTSAHTRYGENGEERTGTTREEELGTIRPGETITVTYDAYVDEDLPYGTTDVFADARLLSDEPENNDEDNRERLTLVAERQAPSSGGGSSGGSGGGGSSSGAGTVLGAKVTRDKDREIDPSAPPSLEIIKSADFDDDKEIKAGTVVNYTLLIRNWGDEAYNASVADILKNPIGSVVSEQSWDLGTILAGEQIELTYEIKYDENTPSGEYENIAKLVAYEEKDDPESKLKVHPSTHTLNIKGRDLAVGNVEVLVTIPTGGGNYSSLISWETNKPSDSQIFFSPKGAGVSPFNPAALNYGYDRKSVHFTNKSTKHYMLLTGLAANTEYVYRIRSSDGKNVALGGDYTLNTSSAISLALLGGSQQRSAPAPEVADQRAPTPPPAPRATPPAPTPRPTPPPAPREPEPTVAGVSTVAPAMVPVTPEPQPQQSGGLFGGVVKKVGGFLGF